MSVILRSDQKEPALAADGAIPTDVSAGLISLDLLPFRCLPHLIYVAVSHQAAPCGCSVWYPGECVDSVAHCDDGFVIHPLKHHEHERQVQHIARNDNVNNALTELYLAPLR